MLRPLKIKAFGDVHNGHSSTPTIKISEEIRECFPYGKDAAGTDILVLDGDWYDKLLPNNHQDAIDTEVTMYYLLRYCKDHDIVFCIVDGTPLHDAGQIQKFLHINKEAKIDAEVILVDTIDIVYISKYDVNVLFVPDRPRTTPQETFSIVQEKLKQHNIEQVDFAIMHGCFQYQLPELAPDHKHNEEDYENIVKGPIIIGHIHKHSSKGKIIAPGSFSRLTHGEEEPKGYIEVILQPSGEFKAKFIENKTATIYKTINITGLSLQDSFDKIKRNVEPLPPLSRVRIECEQGHPISLDKTFMVLKMENIDIYWSIKINTDKSIIANQEEVFSIENDYVPLVINPDNIEELILLKAEQKGYSPQVIKTIPNYLNEILKED